MNDEGGWVYALCITRNILVLYDFQSLDVLCGMETGEKKMKHETSFGGLCHVSCEP
jgi:hypothetical protein